MKTCFLSTILSLCLFAMGCGDADDAIDSPVDTAPAGVHDDHADHDHDHAAEDAADAAVEAGEDAADAATDAAEDTADAVEEAADTDN